MMIEVPARIRRQLIRDVLRGKIDPALYPELFEPLKTLTPSQRDAEIERLKRKLFSDD